MSKLREFVQYVNSATDEELNELIDKSGFTVGRDPSDEKLNYLIAELKKHYPVEFRIHREKYANFTTIYHKDEDLVFDNKFYETLVDLGLPIIGEDGLEKIAICYDFAGEAFEK